MSGIYKGYRCQVSGVRSIINPRYLFSIRKYQASLLLLLILTSTLIAKEVTDDRKILYIDEQIRFADGLVSRGHYDLAIEEYIRLTKKFADDPLAAEAWVQLAEAYSAKKDYKSAIATFETFFKKFPQARIVPAANLKYALILHKTKDAANAKRAFQMLALLKNDKDSPEVIKDAATFYLSKLYLADKENEKAAKELEALVKKDIKKSPEHDFRASAVIELAKYKAEKGELQEAVKLLSMVSGKKDLSSTLKTSIQWTLGDLHYENRNYQKASEVFAKFAILFPDSPTVTDALYKRLQALYMMKDYSKVITETDRIIKDGKLPEKGWERFYCLKASALNALKFYKGTFECLDKVLKEGKDPNMSSFAAYKYVQAQINNKDVEGAIATAEKYISQKNFPRQVAKDMAMLISDNSGPAASEKILRKALYGIRPDAENASILKLKLGAVLTNSGKNKEALIVYNDLGKSCRKELKPYALMGEAQALEQLGKRKEAVEKYKILMKQHPKCELYPEAMLRMALMYLADRKEWETSKIYLAELIKRFPDSPTSKLATFYQGYLAFHEKEYEKSKKILSGLLNSKDITTGLKKDIEIYLLWSLIKLKETDSVILIFRSNKTPDKLLSKSPSGFVNELGSLMTQNNPKAAVLCFNELQNRKSKDAVQLGYLGGAKVDIRNGDPVKAIEKLRKASDLDQDPKVTSEALITLGKLLAERGKPDDAVLILEKCIENSTDKNISHRVYFELAKILSKQPDRLKTANRYAMKAYILAKDKEIKAEGMLLSIEILLNQNQRIAANTTWKDYKKNFPDMLDSERAKKIKKLLGD